MLFTLSSTLPYDVFPTNILFSNWKMLPSKVKAFWSFASLAMESNTPSRTVFEELATSNDARMLPKKHSDTDNVNGYSSAQ